MMRLLICFLGVAFLGVAPRQLIPVFPVPVTQLNIPELYMRRRQLREQLERDWGFKLSCDDSFRIARDLPIEEWTN